MCSICNRHPNCPVCGPERRMITCPECGGDGYVYFDEYGNEIRKSLYDMLPEALRDCEACERCKGSGEIEDEWGPDYDDYD